MYDACSPYLSSAQHTYLPEVPSTVYVCLILVLLAALELLALIQLYKKC